MQCQESKKILDAYVDNEVDVVQSAAFEEHLAGCPECAQTLESRRSLKDAMQNADLRYAAPPELVKSVRQQLRLPEEKSAVPKWNWNWFKSAAWGFAAATAMFALVAISLVWHFYTQQDQKMAALVVDGHVRSMQANHLVDVPSSDQHTVKPWFQGRVSFSPKLADFKDKGFPLEGGRLDYVDNKTAAAVVYKRNQHIINVFEYPGSGSSGIAEFQQRGYNVLHWTRDGMQFWVVSDLNESELRQFGELLRE
ncbi:MAG TPA: anti-sigma factor [Candidatus Angelobacter sp.]